MYLEGSESTIKRSAAGKRSCTCCSTGSCSNGTTFNSPGSQTLMSPEVLASPVQGHTRPTVSHHTCAFSNWSSDSASSSYSSLLTLPDPHLPRAEDTSLERSNLPSFPVAGILTRCEPMYRQQVHSCGFSCSTAISICRCLG